MSTRRVPLSSNPNVANSPLRGVLAPQGSKRARSHAELQREEAYGQPPPAKRQMLDVGSQRQLKPALEFKSTRTASQRPSSLSSRTAAAEKSIQQSVGYKLTEKEIENVRQWQTQIRTRFPKMVFYFESIPDDQRSRLTKQVTHLGAREEKFFSIDITHVVTTRSIPSEKAVPDEPEHVETSAAHEQPKTIDPSLLNRNLDGPTGELSGKRRLLFETGPSRRLPIHIHEDAIRRPKSRNTDILCKARDMGKKIWSLEKLQKILDMVLEPDPYKSALLGQGLRTAPMQKSSTSKGAEQSNLLQLLQNERVHGPSDRDPTVTTRELIYFKGPYLYVYDIEEKQKPIMVREYAKVADKKDGDWPQFRVASQGRCPFIEDPDPDRERHRVRARERISKATAEAKAPVLKPPTVAAPERVPGKRSLTETDTAQNRGTRRTVGAIEDSVETFDLARASNPPAIDFGGENVFTSRAKAGRLFAGEPVASGVQPSHITSAIRSQMISSTSGTLGVKAGTSKEIHGLQRKVLQRNSTPSITPNASHDGPASFVRSASLGRTAQRKLDMIDEDDNTGRRLKLRRTESAPAPPQGKQRKRDPKPGYCENCNDKFDDFEEHIVSRKHRKFADNDKNWAELDALLGQLRRPPRYQLHDGQEEHW
ncbi:hypothetical protein VTK73DRAFT_5818 [Phialemonium thermophilum]|uniref:DBF4-type domain-containing protein n=1 Tax=Phialemonium thermophilum TaxID=223376 RepID=A0ABR3WLS1_9PEZI